MNELAKRDEPNALAIETQESLTDILNFFATCYPGKLKPESITVSLIRLWSAALSQIDATKSEIETAAAQLALNSEWTPSPASFAQTIQRNRELARLQADEARLQSCVERLDAHGNLVLVPMERAEEFSPVPEMVFELPAKRVTPAQTILTLSEKMRMKR